MEGQPPAPNIFRPEVRSTVEFWIYTSKLHESGLERYECFLLCFGSRTFRAGSFGSFGRVPLNVVGEFVLKFRFRFWFSELVNDLVVLQILEFVGRSCDFLCVRCFHSFYDST